MSKPTNPGSTGALHQKLGKEVQDDLEFPQDDDQPELELTHESYNELQKQLNEAEDMANTYKDQLMRTQADMKNMQRRVELDLANAHKYALEKFAIELLPVVDNLERAIAAHVGDDSGAGTLLDGINMTLNMFTKTMEKFGIESIDPEGKPFNPEFHQAVSTLDSANVPSNTVLNVLQKGYLLNNRLIRPALVVVAK